MVYDVVPLNEKRLILHYTKSLISALLQATHLPANCVVFEL